MRTLALLFALTLSCLAQPLSPTDPAFLQSTSPLRRGLVGYWRLEEASGTRYDCSSQGGHLTSNNSVAQASGKVSNCALFVQASLQSLTKPDPYLDFSLASPFTMQAWVNLTNTGIGQGIIGKCQSFGNVIGYDWGILENAGAGLLVLFSSGGGGYLGVSGTSNVFNGSWNWVAATYNGSGTTNGMALYINGGLDPISTVYVSGSMVSIHTSAPFAVGSRSTDSNVNGNLPANGLIDEVGVWSRVLTAAELTQLYNAGRGTHFPWAHP